jgi:RimJ/RimL family protein N-acetyltransferase
VIAWRQEARHTATMPTATPLDASPYRLRPFDVDGLTHYAALFTDPGVMRAVGAPLDGERAARAAAASLRHQHAIDGRFRHWLVERAGETAGLLGLALRSDRWSAGEAELGVLLWPAWQARGAATAAILAVRPWAFEIAGLATLTCHHADDHGGAAALMRRVGFTRCAARSGSPLPVGWECRAAPAVGGAAPPALG